MATTYNDAREAVEVLKTFISDALEADYAATFQRWRGADVILEDEEAPAQRVGRPYIMLTLQGSENATETWGRGAWRVTVRADVVAGGNSGALKGAVNPIGSDTLLSRALKTIVRDGYADLRDSGLFRCKVADPRENNNSDTNGVQHTNTHTIEFIYFDS